MPDALAVADFVHVLQYRSPFGAFVHCVCSPWLNRTPLHQSSTTTPQNGSSVSGFAVPAFGAAFDACFARTFFAAADRFDTVKLDSKSNSPSALSTPHVSTPSSPSWRITASAKFAVDVRIPASTAAAITMDSLDIFRIFVFFWVL